MTEISEYKSRWSLLRKSQLWPLVSRLDPEGWLKNFTPAEKAHSFALLDSFLYFSASSCRRLFIHGVRRLSQTICTDKPDVIVARNQWNDFLDRMIIVRVTGENPSDADSGFIFTRMARDTLDVAESQIMTPSRALVKLLSSSNTPLLFVDDFAGSGNQFATLWVRKYRLGGGVEISFADVALTHSITAYYVPLISAWIAEQRILTDCAPIVLSPTYRLEETASLLHPNCPAWPDSLRASAADFLYRASMRAGLEEKGGAVGDWKGFSNLALAVAFEHGVPDATLPIFTHSATNWHPLITRA